MLGIISIDKGFFLISEKDKEAPLLKDAKLFDYNEMLRDENAELRAKIAALKN